MKIYKIQKKWLNNRTIKKTYISNFLILGQKKKHIAKSEKKSMFLNLTKNQNSNDERYVQKKTNLDTKIHRITGKNNKKSDN